MRTAISVACVLACAFSLDAQITATLNRSPDGTTTGDAALMTRLILRRSKYLPPEQLVAGRLYQSIVGKLMNLPEEPLGSPFPPTPFVEQETAMLNRQRVTLAESQPSLADAVLIER